MENQYDYINSLVLAETSSLLENVDEKYKDGDNWNERYQYAISLPDTTEEEKQRKCTLLSSVNQDFMKRAENYAKSIINEYFSEDKSVPIKRLGGVGGGKKYLCHGIMFKLADGSIGPYEGNDEAAAKAIGHDLKGAAEYLKCKIPGLCTALQVIIDFKGFRMDAQAFLPVSPETLKVGTADACKTIQYEDEELIRKMKEAAEKLNLKPHYIRGQLMYSGCDVEGHLGHDNHYYLLDLARTFPPESPIAADHLDPKVVGFSPGQMVSYTPTGSIRKYPAKIQRELCVGERYEISYQSGKFRSIVEAGIHELNPAHMSIFWRLLRPEFVQNGGRQLLESKRKRDQRNNPAEQEPTEPVQSVPTDSENSRAPMVKSLSQPLKKFQMRSASLPSTDIPLDLKRSESEDPRSTEFFSNRMLNERHSDTTPFLFHQRSRDCQKLCNQMFQNSQDGCPITELAALPEDIPQQDPGYSEYGHTRHEYYSFCSTSESNAMHANSESETPGWSLDSFQPSPLSSDALSTFSDRQSGHNVDNHEVHIATRRLLEQVIPAAAEELCEMDDEMFDKTQIHEFLHVHGINVRHMGLLRSKVQLDGSSRISELRERLLLEIVSRSLKNLLRESQRKWMKQKRVCVSERGMHGIVSRFLNCVTGAVPDSNEFWKMLVLPRLYKQFGKVALTEDEQEDLQQCCQGKGAFLQALLYRLCEVTGVRLREDVMERFIEEYESTSRFKFDDTHIRELIPRVKGLHQGDEAICAKAFPFYRSGESISSPKQTTLVAPSDPQENRTSETSQELLDLEVWACTQCTVLNPTGSFTCEVCGKPKTKTAPEQKWACGQCTVLNPTASTICEVCGFPKQKALEEEMWTCSQCTVRNPTASNMCEMCGSPKPKVHGEDRWTCAQCTYANSGNRSSCEMCGSKKIQEEGSNSTDPIKEESMIDDQGAPASNSKSQGGTCSFVELLGSTLVKRAIQATLVSVEVANTYPFAIMLHQKASGVTVTGFQESEFSQMLSTALEKDDVLLSVNGETVESVEFFNRLCGRIPDNEKLSLKFERRNVTQVPVETSLALKDKVVGLFFASSSCKPSVETTKKLVPIYEHYKEKGLDFEIVLISGDTGSEEYDQLFANIPWFAVPFSESKIIDEISQKYEVQFIPFLPILNKDGSLITAQGLEAIRLDPQGHNFPWYRKSIYQLLPEQLLTKDGMTTADIVKGKYVGIYFGGSWCPACIDFAPKLVEVFRNIMMQGMPFEIIYVSSDKSQEAFDFYYEFMPWFAIPYEDKKSKESLNSNFNVMYIPHFVMFDPEGSVINENAAEKVSKDIQGEEFPWATS